MKIIKTLVKTKERLLALEGWQRKKLLSWLTFFLLIGIIYLTYTCTALYKDKTAEDSYWENGLKDNEEALQIAMEYKDQATAVTAGTYVENIREISVKNSNFRVIFTCWFKWEDNENLDMVHNFRVYNGTINKLDVLKDETYGSTHYQLARVDATIAKNYWIVRFPLESYQLRFYLEPAYSAERVQFIPDTENSCANPNMTISGFKLMRNAVSIYSIKYPENTSDIEEMIPVTQELCTSLEVNRTSIGLFIKCFIALFGTITWIFITIYLCAFHRVDPLGMIPSALFGTVTNIMVGANLLPDNLQIGLLEYVNVAGIMVILAGAISVININRIRTKYQDTEFAFLFGRTMLIVLAALTLAGVVLFPLCAYRY